MCHVWYVFNFRTTWKKTIPRQTKHLVSEVTFGPPETYRKKHLLRPGVFAQSSAVGMFRWKLFTRKFPMSLGPIKRGVFVGNGSHSSLPVEEIRWSSQSCNMFLHQCVKHLKWFAGCFLYNSMEIWFGHPRSQVVALWYVVLSPECECVVVSTVAVGSSCWIIGTQHCWVWFIFFCFWRYRTFELFWGVDVWRFLHVSVILWGPSMRCSESHTWKRSLQGSMKSCSKELIDCGTCMKHYFITKGSMYRLDTTEALSWTSNTRTGYSGR